MLIVVLERKKIISTLIILAATLGIILGYYLLRHQQTQGRLSRLVVVIDPGHGGVDGGTRDHRGNLEKEINLQIGLVVRQQLRQSGLSVIMTRETDTDLAPFHSGHYGRHRRDLLHRIEIARQNHSLFLVSIHCDACADAPEKRGAFLFYNYLSPVSKGLAGSIQDKLNEVQERPGKIAPGKYLVIRQKGVTGVIVEAGYLTHRQEAELLQTPGYREKLGLAISAGILRFCQEFIGEGEHQKTIASPHDLIEEMQSFS